MAVDNTLYDILNNYSLNQGNKTAYIELLEGNEINKINYHDLSVKVMRLGVYFQRHQLSGKQCILFFSAGIDAVATILACLISGVIPIVKAINKNMDPERFNFQLDVLLQSLPDLSAIISTNDFFSTFKNKSIQKIQNLIIEDADFISSSEVFIKTPKNKDVAIIQLTSGSTGMPKALKISNNNLFYNLYYCTQAWECDSNSRIVTWAPHSHVFGLITGLLLPLYVGGTSIIMQPTDFSNDPLSWIEMISKYQATHSGAPDFAYMKCVASYSENRMINCNLSSWAVASSGGEMIKEETLNGFYQTFRKHGFNFNSYCPSYGMSENSGIVCSVLKQEIPEYIPSENYTENNVPMTKSLNFNPIKNIVSVGKPLYETKIVIVNPTNLLLLPDYHVGEILIYSPSMCDNYINEHKVDNFCELLFDNQMIQFFRTGDIGFMKLGALYIIGRLKEVLIIKGKNYSPHDIESCVLKFLNKHFLGKNAAFSVKKENGEEVAILYQEIRGSWDKLNQSQLKAQIKKITKFYLGLDLHDVVLLNENIIPLTASNKVQRLGCKEHYFLH